MSWWGNLVRYNFIFSSYFWTFITNIVINNYLIAILQIVWFYYILFSPRAMILMLLRHIIGCIWSCSISQIFMFWICIADYIFFLRNFQVLPTCKKQAYQVYKLIYFKHRTINSLQVPSSLHHTLLRNGNVCEWFT